MAIIGGTVQTFSRKGLRESLSDRIYNVDPSDTPLVSMIGVGPRARQTLEEWQTDVLRAPASNQQVEGDQFSYSEPDPTVRVGNYTQILRETASVSDTTEAVDKAGRKSEMAYQIMKKGLEIRLDLEYAVTNHQAANAGGAATARAFAGLDSWLKSNTNFSNSGSGADPTYTSGVPGATRVDNETTRAFTETIAKNVISQGYANGAKFKVLMVGPFNKQVVSTGFTGIVTRNFDISNVDPRPTAAIAAIDVYVHDFGVLRVVPNRVQRERDAWFLDPEYAEMRYLRPFRTKRLADISDGMQKAIIAEVTLAVLSEQALGGAFDLNVA